MTASDILQALLARYSHQGHYVPIPEFRPGTGYGHNSERRFDLYVLDCYGPITAIALEIKVSRQDFLQELNNPEKRRLALHFSHEYYFVAPKGLIDPQELPPEAGLIEATQTPKGITLKQTRPALRRESKPTWRFVAALCRRLNNSDPITSTIPLAQQPLQAQIRQLARQSNAPNSSSRL